VDPLRIGVLGTARISTTALLEPAASVPEVTVTAVAARDRSRAAAYAQEHPGDIRYDYAWAAAP
jgi:predicted dehydrogenase